MVRSDSDKRRVRFASIHGISREDLPFAAEVWQSDLLGQIWTTPEIIKLSIVLVRYMRGADENLLCLRRIQDVCEVDQPAVCAALRKMQMFGAVEAYCTEGGILQASLCLSLLQRVRVLELRERLIELGGSSSMPGIAEPDYDRPWSPPYSTDSEAQTHEPGQSAGQTPRMLPRSGVQLTTVS